jgi:benzodiazapine receptor
MEAVDKFSVLGLHSRHASEEDRMRKAARAIVAIGICELAGIIGSLFTRPSIPGWYAGLAKPSFNPPSAVFGPVWITLYALMGIAAWLVYESGLKGTKVRRPLAIFVAQLVLNVLWSIMFFGIHHILGGFVIIVALWILIAATIKLFWPVSKTAAVLLVPYLLWVGFATVLNAALYVLNH